MTSDSSFNFFFSHNLYNNCNNTVMEQKYSDDKYII